MINNVKKVTYLYKEFKKNDDYYQLTTESKKLFQYSIVS